MALIQSHPKLITGLRMGSYRCREYKALASSRERAETGNEEGTENEESTENEEGTETGGTTAFQVPQFEGAQFEVPEPHEFPTTSLSKRLKVKNECETKNKKQGPKR